MTGPTAEQVNRERERAHAVMETLGINPCSIWEGTRAAPDGHINRCDAVATALARVRIEAVEGAARAAIERAHDLGIPAERQESIAKAIRALRGRT